ncbi:MAG: TolB protein [Mariprofundaceae bacterium]
MLKFIPIIITLAVLAIPSTASALPDWLSSDEIKKANALKDDAVLLTLESKESEMYPRASKDGNHLLVNVQKRKNKWVSRRLTENGDEINVVSDDPRALDSTRFSGDHITFLSKRTGTLGLWKKASDGIGIVRRVKELYGNLTQPILLSNGEVIAVRLEMIAKTRGKASGKSDGGFNDWNIPGYRSSIVRIDANGHEESLAYGSNPALSPDGKWLVYSVTAGRSVHLYIMRPDGSDIAQLTTARSVDAQPAWSPDGKWIVFTSNRANVDLKTPSRNAWDLWAIDSEGRQLTQLTEDAGRDGGASVSSNGRVYFHSDRKLSKELRAERQVTGNTGKYHIWSVELPK